MAVKKTLLPMDLYNFKSVGDAQVSPDGRKVLFGVSQAEEKTDGSVTNIWMADVTTKKQMRFTSSGKDRSPRWSPDGKRFAFISNRSGKSQIFIAEMDGGEPWNLKTDQSVGGAPLWSPDGKYIVFTSREFAKDEGWTPYPGAPEWDRRRAENQARKSLAGRPAPDGKKPEKDGQEGKKDHPAVKTGVKVATRYLYRSDGVGVRGDLSSHVYVVSVPDCPLEGEEKATVRRLTDGDYNHSAGSFSPDGKYLLIPALREEDTDFLSKQDFWLVEFSTGRIMKFMDGIGPARAPQWSPDGSKLAFLGHDNSDGSSTTASIWVLDASRFLRELEEKGGHSLPEPLSMKDAEDLTKEFDRPIGNMASSDVAYFGGSPPFFWEDNGVIGFLACDKGATGLFRLSLAGETPTIERVWHDPNRTIASISRGGPGNRTVVLEVGTPSRPNCLYLYDTVSGSDGLSLLVDFNGWLSDYALGDWERFTYKGDKDWDIDGWLVYPARGKERGELSPTVLLIHGGPHGAYGSAFMFQAQMFASRGYAVLYTNPRGSQTYGQEFANAVVRDWGGADYRDIMAGVDYVIAKGVADPDKLFVTGWSYGGYMSSWVITQTNRFKAAMAGAIISNLYSMWGTGDIPNYDEHQWGVPPWEARDEYFKMSPITYVTNVETPVLFIHGENDIRCPTSQSEEFYLSLRRLNKTAVFVRYPGEFHGFRKPSHKLDRFERTIAWFDYYCTKED